MVVQKTPQEIELMARAGEILAAVHEAVRDTVGPGMTTADIDAVAAEEIAARGGRPGAVAERHRLAVIAEHDGHYVGGHGIGRDLHEDPMVPGTGRPGRGMRLRPGLVFAIEPMFVLGTPAWRQHADGWTLSSLDGSLAAHWEHTVAVTEQGPRVLTARPGEVDLPSRPALAAEA